MFFSFSFSSRQAMLAAQRHGDDHPRSGGGLGGHSLGNSLGSGGPSDSMCHDDDDERVDVVGNDHRPDSVSPPPVRHHGKYLVCSFLSMFRSL